MITPSAVERTRLLASDPSFALSLSVPVQTALLRASGEDPSRYVFELLLVPDAFIGGIKG